MVWNHLGIIIFWKTSDKPGAAWGEGYQMTLLGTFSGRRNKPQNIENLSKSFFCILAFQDEKKKKLADHWKYSKNLLNKLVVKTNRSSHRPSSRQCNTQCFLSDSSGGCNCGNIRFSLSFLDIDECIQGSHDCLQSLAFCSNTNGSYNCTCHDGYMGDGKTFCNPKGRITGT